MEQMSGNEYTNGMMKMKLNKEKMIEMIVDTELDGMDYDALIQYAEDKLYEHFDGKDDDYIQDVFYEVFENDLERVVDENYEDHKEKDGM